MINEGIFRSPKWLRNFLDFEINTGSDIKGEPSKRVLAKEEKRKQEKILNEWDIAWNNAIEENSFRNFLNIFLNKEGNNYITYSEMGVIRKKFRGNSEIFSKYKKYLEDKENEKKRQENLHKEIDKIINSIWIDFCNAPYNDKISSYKNNKNEYCIIYTFENGNIIDIFDINNNKFRYDTSTESNSYTVGSKHFNNLISIINKITKLMRNRPKSSNSSYRKEKYNNDNQKRNKYYTLLKTIELREKQLSKMSKDDSDWMTLQNELDTAKSMAKRMKDTYKFENLMNFKNYYRYNS